MATAIGSGATDIGRIRERNEDAFAIGDLDQATLFDGDGALTCAGPRGLFAIVCDGMGGAAGGDVASELATRVTWRELCEAHTTDDPQVFGRLLRRAVRAANRAVFDEGQREVNLRGMGTTLSALGLAGGHLVIAQVGDSRVYLARGGELTQITRDQTLASALVGAGRDPHEAALAGGSTILQALGVNVDVEPSLSITALCKGDRVLACSDGLYNQLGLASLEAIVVGKQAPEVLARTLCDAARAAGGADNITAIVIDVTGDELPPAAGQRAPKFVEFDPREDGERALTSTSYVVRRLAAAAGIGADPGQPVIPATGRHPTVLVRPPRPIAPTASSRGRDRLITPLVLVAIALVAGGLGWWLAG